MAFYILKNVIIEMNHSHTITQRDRFNSEPSGLKFQAKRSSQTNRKHKDTQYNLFKID